MANTTLQDVRPCIFNDNFNRKFSHKKKWQTRLCKMSGHVSSNDNFNRKFSHKKKWQTLLCKMSGHVSSNDNFNRKFSHKKKWQTLLRKMSGHASSNYNFNHKFSHKKKWQTLLCKMSGHVSSNVSLSLCSTNGTFTFAFVFEGRFLELPRLLPGLFNFKDLSHALYGLGTPNSKQF